MAVHYAIPNPNVGISDKFSFQDSVCQNRFVCAKISLRSVTDLTVFWFRIYTESFHVKDLSPHEVGCYLSRASSYIVLRQSMRHKRFTLVCFKTPFNLVKQRQIFFEKYGVSNKISTPYDTIILCR